MRYFINYPKENPTVKLTKIIWGGWDFSEHVLQPSHFKKTDTQKTTIFTAKVIISEASVLAPQFPLQDRAEPQHF